MKLLDTPNQRKNMKSLTECHDNFLLESFNKTMIDAAESNHFPSSEIQNKPSKITPFVNDFNDLKKMNSDNQLDFVAQFNVLQGR